MSVTQAAADRVQHLVAGADRPIAGLRVGVKNGGCAGMSYTLQFAEAIGPYDEVIEDRGVKILIDPKALMFLFGTEMDFKTDKLGSGFTFNNPNQTGACGCGESVSISPASEAQLEEARAGAGR
jgi:iron-sulfur cluster assembly protein